MILILNQFQDFCPKWTHHAHPLNHQKLQLALGPLPRAWVPVAPSWPCHRPSTSCKNVVEMISKNGIIILVVKVDHPTPTPRFQICSRYLFFLKTTYDKLYSFFSLFLCFKVQKNKTFTVFTVLSLNL